MFNGDRFIGESIHRAGKGLQDLQGVHDCFTFRVVRGDVERHGTVVEPASLDGIVLVVGEAGRFVVLRHRCWRRCQWLLLVIDEQWLLQVLLDESNALLDDRLDFRPLVSDLAVQIDLQGFDIADDLHLRVADRFEELLVRLEPVEVRLRLVVDRLKAVFAGLVQQLLETLNRRLDGIVGGRRGLLHAQNHRQVRMEKGVIVDLVQRDALVDEHDFDVVMEVVGRRGVQQILDQRLRARFRLIGDLEAQLGEQMEVHALHGFARGESDQIQNGTVESILVVRVASERIDEDVIGGVVGVHGTIEVYEEREKMNGRRASGCQTNRDRGLWMFREAEF